MRTKRHFLRILILMALTPSIAFSSELCRNLFSAGVEKVVIPTATYNKEVKNLRATLSGKLATVWRSEWKTKLPITESNQYVYNLVNKFLTAETRDVVLKNLDITSNGFTREVHTRLYELQMKKLLVAGDELAVRDSPPPIGARDTTFTYYTKPIESAVGEGKHQVRIRTYLREIRYNRIPVGESVQGFNVHGKLISVTRLSNDTIKLTMGTDKLVEVEMQLSMADMITKNGATMRLFAPHGKNYKLEIKSALTDEISATDFPRLAGKHMVQKLDVGLTMNQVSQLFAPLKSKTAAAQRSESIDRIKELSSELIAKTPENKARIEAVFEVLLQGVKGNAQFLMIEGATAYHRTAFETTTGLQTTIDRDQGVYEGNMYGDQFLKNPIYTLQSNHLINTKAKDARHVELKVPVTSMEHAVGIEFADPTAAPSATNAQFDQRIKEMVGVYHQFVKNALHAGKFNYIRANGELQD